MVNPSWTDGATAGCRGKGVGRVELEGSIGVTGTSIEVNGNRLCHSLSGNKIVISLVYKMINNDHIY